MSTLSPKVYGKAGPFAIEATADLRKSMMAERMLGIGADRWWKCNVCQPKSWV
jgi:hypothetical protein